MRELLAKRKATQPIGEWSCGSMFTNPPGDHAARLIEAAGLKGFASATHRCRTKHANFIINARHATAADIEQLIAHVQDDGASDSTACALHPEVRIVGEAA